MPTRFTLVIDCADADRLTHFWAEALGYAIEGPPGGFSDWREFWRSKGVGEEDLGEGDDRIFDPAGVGPRFWFHQVPERKTVKNRLHLDLNVSGGYAFDLPTRRQRVDAAVERLVRLGATRIGPLDEEGVDHYAVAMEDPEGNEFDVN